MKNFKLVSESRGAKIAALMLSLAALTGCESMDDGSTHTSTSVYYGVGFYDPWYHGHYDDDYDVIVTPPPERPGSDPRPSHPIARPPASAGPRPTPMRSIPSAPRPAPRGGGRR